MINFAVCDDNLHFADMLMKRIISVCVARLPETIEFSTAPVFHSAAEVLGYLEHHLISVLFLDIDMPDVDGFQLAKALVEDYPDILIIFVSAHDDYVYSSFEYSPFRFLRKSHISTELEPVLLKAVDKLISENATVRFDTTDGEQIVRLHDIMYLKADKNYYLMITISGRIIRCRGALNDIEEQLEKCDFFRVNPGFIVNEEHIDSYGKERYITMKDGTVIEISTRKSIAFKRSYMYFLRKRVSDA